MEFLTPDSKAEHGAGKSMEQFSLRPQTRAEGSGSPDLSQKPSKIWTSKIPSFRFYGAGNSMEQSSLRPQTRAEGSGDSVHLTSGSLAKILQGLDVKDPVLQVLGSGPIQFNKKIYSHNVYDIILSDGLFASNTIFLSMRDSVKESQLISFTIIKLNKYQYLRPEGEGGTSGIAVYGFEVLAKMGVRIGNPTYIRPDGKISQDIQNRNTNHGPASMSAAGSGRGPDKNIPSLPPVKLLRSDAKTPHQASGGTDKSLKVAAEQKQEKQEKQEKEDEHIAVKVSCERQNEQSTKRSRVTTPEIKILHETLEGKDEGKGRFNMFLDVAASLVYSGDLVRLSEYI